MNLSQWLMEVAAYDALIVVGAYFGEFAGVQYRVRAGQLEIPWFYWVTTEVHCPEPGKDWCLGQSC